MMIKSTRRVLLTAYPEPPNPGGLIVPPAIAVVKRVRSARTAIWDMSAEEFTDGENICDTNLTHTTFTGSGEWCGYFGNILNEHGYNNRYLNLSLSGTIYGFNSNEFIWYLYADSPSAWWTWETFYTGSAAVDPTDNCSQAHNLLVEQHTNGSPIPMAAWGWNWQTYGVDIISSYVPDPFIINRTTRYGHPTSGLFPADGINTPFGADSRSTPGIIQINNDSEKRFLADDYWFLGQFAGVWKTSGQVIVTLSNEQTLYDQLVLDGASVTPTRGSRIVSMDNESGVYDATVSAVTFLIPDNLNQLGVEYVVKFRVRRTPDGGEPVFMEILHYYTGNGNTGETLTLQIPPAINSTTEFVGECVSLIPSVTQGEYDNFERLSDGQWFGPNDPIAAWSGWNAPMQFVCNDGRLSVDSFRGLPASPDDTSTIIAPLNTGQCWQNGWRFSSRNDVTFDDFEAKDTSSVLAIWDGGIGWLATGIFYEEPQELSYDNFDDLTLGTVTQWSDSDGLRWRSVGGFASDTSLPNLSYDNFDDLTPGTVTQWGAGNNWQDNGAYFT